MLHTNQTQNLKFDLYLVTLDDLDLTQGYKRLRRVGENGVAWPVWLLSQLYISHSWQSGEDIDYHGNNHRHEDFL